VSRFAAPWLRRAALVVLRATARLAVCLFRGLPRSRHSSFADVEEAGMTTPFTGRQAPLADAFAERATAGPGSVNGHLLFVALSLDVGGAERHLSSVLPELARRGWPVTLYCTNRLGTYAPDVERSGVEVIGPPVKRKAGAQSTLGRLYASTRAGARLFSVMRRIRPAVVHFFLPEPYLIGAPTALFLRVPILIMSRRGLNLYQRNWPGAAAIERNLHRHMTAVLANSRRVAADLASEGCPAERIGLIYNGVALAGLEGPRGRLAIRHSLGIPQDAVVAIVVANLIHYKGHADLLEALARVAGALPPGFRVLCIGRDEGALASLEAQRASFGLDGMVSFIGVRNDVPDLLAASDFSILPSHEEGFSNAIIEAMAAGLPLAVTDVGGNPEAVVDGETGIIVPAKSPAPLGAAIERLATDPELRRRLGAAGRERVREKFSLRACVDRYETLYRGLLSGKLPGELELD
jgi:glycosyltransferase involved in cell wall biosynthesis